MFEKRRNLLVILVLFACIHTVSANFACGEVRSAPGVDISPSWFSVHLFYEENPQATTLCSVSPANNKYCCDPTAITQVQWQPGKDLYAYVSQDGYFAGPEQLTISGEGYDVFSPLILQEPLALFSPNQSIFVNKSSILVNISSVVSTSLSYELIRNDVVFFQDDLCSSCSSYAFTLEDLPSGTYTLKVYASEGDMQTISHDFEVLDYLRFERAYSCRRCKDGYVPSGAEVEMTIRIESSNNLSGQFYDYYPQEWKLVDPGESLASLHSESHTALEWNISGNQIERTYVLQAPEVFFTQNYDFFSGYDHLEGPSSSLSVYKYYQFLGLPHRRAKQYSHLHEFPYIQASPQEPLVMNISDDFLLQSAIFPSAFVSHPIGYYDDRSPVRKRGANDYFVLATSLPSQDISRVWLQLRAEHSLHRSRHLSSFELYKYDAFNQDWALQSLNYTHSDEQYAYYEAHTEGVGAYAISLHYEREGGIFSWIFSNN